MYFKADHINKWLFLNMCTKLNVLDPKPLNTW